MLASLNKNRTQMQKKKFTIDAKGETPASRVSDRSFPQNAFAVSEKECRTRLKLSTLLNVSRETTFLWSETDREAWMARREPLIVSSMDKMELFILHLYFISRFNWLARRSGWGLGASIAKKAEPPRDSLDAFMRSNHNRIPNPIPVMYFSIRHHEAARRWRPRALPRQGKLILRATY